MSNREEFPLQIVGNADHLKLMRLLKQAELAIQPNLTFLHSFINILRFDIFCLFRKTCK